MSPGDERRQLVADSRVFLARLTSGRRLVVEIHAEEETSLPSPLEVERWERAAAPGDGEILAGLSLLCRPDARGLAAEIEGGDKEPRWAAAWEVYRRQLAEVKAYPLPAWADLDGEVQEAFCAAGWELLEG
jgi:hypothetical protein